MCEFSVWQAGAKSLLKIVYVISTLMAVGVFFFFKDE